MQRAMKLMLVDPRHIEYRELGKSPQGQAKADLSLNMRKTLNDDDMSDDLKMKIYREMQNRFMNMGNTVSNEPMPPINYEPVEQKTITRRKKRNSVHYPTGPLRRSRRKVKPTWYRY